PVGAACTRVLVSVHEVHDAVLESLRTVDRRHGDGVLRRAVRLDVGAFLAFATEEAQELAALAAHGLGAKKQLLVEGFEVRDAVASEPATRLAGLLRRSAAHRAEEDVERDLGVERAQFGEPCDLLGGEFGPAGGALEPRHASLDLTLDLAQ